MRTSKRWIVMMTLLAIVLPSQTLGAPGFTYTLVDTFAFTNVGEATLSCFAFNDLAQVAYVTDRSVYNSSTGYFDYIYSLYFWNGQSSQLVFQTIYRTDPLSTEKRHFQCYPGRKMGLNNDGLISVYSVDSSTNEHEVLFFRPGFGIVGEANALDFFSGVTGYSFRTNGNPNEVGQVGFFYPWNSGPALGTTSANGTVTGYVYGTFNFNYWGDTGPVINNKGQSAMLAVRGSNEFLSILDFDPTRFPGSSTQQDERVRRTDIGPLNEWEVLAGNLGFNDLGYASLVTHGTQFSQSPFRVVLLGPDRQSAAILADSVDFPNLVGRIPGGALNNLNEVLFGVQQNLNNSIQASLWIDYPCDGILAPCGSPPLAVYQGPESIPAIGNAIPTAIGGHSTYPVYHQYSINDHSEVVFVVSYHNPIANRTEVALLVAHPEPGLLPGTPVLPRPEDLLEFGWRFANPCTNLEHLELFPPGSTLPQGTPCRSRFLGTPGGWTVRVGYFDPPIATGYTYTVDAGSSNFATVLIPTPLPGGDKEFTLEFNGTTVELSAGQLYHFTDVVPQGIASFKITGIDVGESLAPTDPTAFVTGLAWIDDGRPINFTMIPLVVNTDPTGDTDGDGIADDVDNCPSNANPDQADSDGDGIGNICDPDDDNDGVADEVDNCPVTANPSQGDADADGVGDACDPDDDGDGIADEVDGCPVENATGLDADGNGCIDSFSALSEVINTLVTEGVIDPTMATSLTSKIDNAQKSADKENVCAAVNQLGSFKNQIEAQRGSKISTQAAELLIAYANNLITRLLSALPEGASC